MESLTKPLHHFIDLLEQKAIPYAIIGGIASIARHRIKQEAKL